MLAETLNQQLHGLIYIYSAVHPCCSPKPTALRNNSHWIPNLRRASAGPAGEGWTAGAGDTVLEQRGGDRHWAAAARCRAEHHADFAAWYPADGRPGLSPARLALVSVLQYTENLTDRQAAEAVRCRKTCWSWSWSCEGERYRPGMSGKRDTGFAWSLNPGGQAEVHVVAAGRLSEPCCHGWGGQTETRVRIVIGLSTPSIRPWLFTQAERVGPAAVRRLVTVAPGMCGSLKALAACAGDWTWETVGAVCGLDVPASDAGGEPSYLAFYYVRITSDSVQPRRFTFGDRLEVQSQVFEAGPLSVVTVHRIRRVSELDPESSELFGVEEAFLRPRADCVYVENLNVWLGRGAGGGNVGLVYSPPAGFAQARLPRVPSWYSPRAVCATARYTQVLPDPATGSWEQAGPDVAVEHAVDLVDDVNGVGLLYFASFFSIAERVQLRHWRSLGRSSSSFLDRRVENFRICYLGNADLDSTLSLRLRTTRHPFDLTREKSDPLIRDVSTDRVVAVVSSRYRTSGC